MVGLIMENKEPVFLTLEYALEHLDEFPECGKFCTLPGETIIDDVSIINSLCLFEVNHID